MKNKKAQKSSLKLKSSSKTLKLTYISFTQLELTV